MTTIVERHEATRGWRAAAQVALRVLSIVFFLGVLVQFFLAGVGVFGAESFDAHLALGSLLGLISLLMLVLAIASRRLIALAGGLFLLMALQFLFAGHFGYEQPWPAALHVLNALAVAGVAYALVRAVLPLSTNRSGGERIQA